MGWTFELVLLPRAKGKRSRLDRNVNGRALELYATIFEFYLAHGGALSAGLCRLLALAPDSRNRGRPEYVYGRVEDDVRTIPEKKLS